MARVDCLRGGRWHRIRDLEAVGYGPQKQRATTSKPKERGSSSLHEVMGRVAMCGCCGCGHVASSALLLRLLSSCLHIWGCGVGVLMRWLLLRRM